MIRRALFAASVLVALSSCREGAVREDKDTSGPIKLVFKQQPMWGEPGPFRALLARFEAENPGITVEPQYLPNASDLAHQYYLTALEGGAKDFDVFVVDVIWVPEFAHAGWVADLSSEFSPEQLRADFLPGPADAVVVEGRSYAVPWYTDVGLLYYRTDLVPRAPRTYDELESFARAAMAKDKTLAGYEWQAKQYEGLDCNVFEAIWNHGGEPMHGDHLQVDLPEAAQALAWLRHLVASGLSPASVTAAAEEESRRPFQEGHAVFLRNWPYAWSEASAEGSPIRGKVGFGPLPTRSGAPGAGALGGWDLAVNAHISPRRKAAAAKLVRFLTSERASVELAVHYARNPARRATYDAPELKDRAPFIAQLLPAVEHARPRPVTPYYNLVADVLQGEFSAAVAGLRPPEEALGRAQALIDHLTEAPR